MILQCEMKLIEKKEVELIYIIDIGKYLNTQYDERHYLHKHFKIQGYMSMSKRTDALVDLFFVQSQLNV